MSAMALIWQREGVTGSHYALFNSAGQPSLGCVMRNDFLSIKVITHWLASSIIISHMKWASPCKKKHVCLLYNIQHSGWRDERKFFINRRLEHCVARSMINVCLLCPLWPQEPHQFFVHCAVTIKELDCIELHQLHIVMSYGWQGFGLLVCCVVFSTI